MVCIVTMQKLHSFCGTIVIEFSVLPKVPNDWRKSESQNIKFCHFVSKLVISRKCKMDKGWLEKRNCIIFRIRHKILIQYAKQNMLKLVVFFEAGKYAKYRMAKATVTLVAWSFIHSVLVAVDTSFHPGSSWYFFRIMVSIMSLSANFYIRKGTEWSFNKCQLEICVNERWL